MSNGMRITKYTRKGKDCEHDVHFIKDNTFMRYGTDEALTEKLRKAMMDLTNYATDVSGLNTFMIKRLIFTNDPNNFQGRKCKVEGVTSDRYSNEMKVGLHPIVWYEISEVDEINRVTHTQIVADDERLQPVVESIMKVIEGLEGFVTVGNQQIEFVFAQ